MSKEKAEVLKKADVARLLPPRKRESHKGTYGKAAIVGGSLEYTGAAYLSAAACLRSGAGYTALFVPRDILPYYILKAPELLLKGISEGDRYSFDEEKMRELLDYDAVAYGMGMGVSEEVAKGAAYLLEGYTGRLILDADALNSLAAYKRPLPAVKNRDVVLTPHAKEFSRLSGKTTEEILEEPVEAARSFSKAHGVNVLLKSAVSVVTDGESATLNFTGCSGQAKGGSGDVLSGVIAGLCAQGSSTLDGARAGAYIAGLAAELAAREYGEYSMTATDEIAYLGKAFSGIFD